jgi:glycosyltransferase involved in cell wall biosynthesis
MKFSIITCTYNSEKYLQNNIDSVKNQTIKDYEHIFIDGFSTDKTIEIIEKYRQEFPNRVKLFQYPAKGIANAMNEGIKKSTGEYINHMHSDDSFFSNKVLQEVSNFIDKNNNPDWIYGKAMFIDIKNKNKRIIPHRKIYRKVRYLILLLTNFIPHQSVFIKKKIFIKHGLFDEQYKNFMDYELWIRMAKLKIKERFIDKIICNFSVRRDSQSELGRYTDEYIIVLNKYLKNKIIIKLLFCLHKFNQRRNFL